MAMMEHTRAELASRISGSSGRNGLSSVPLGGGLQRSNTATPESRTRRDEAAPPGRMMTYCRRRATCGATRCARTLIDADAEGACARRRCTERCHSTRCRACTPRPSCGIAAGRARAARPSIHGPTRRCGARATSSPLTFSAIWQPGMDHTRRNSSKLHGAPPSPSPCTLLGAHRVGTLGVAVGANHSPLYRHAAAVYCISRAVPANIHMARPAFSHRFACHRACSVDAAASVVVALGHIHAPPPA